jgi:pSer/pThr/pTyr-binding forkhead associated (FHA) protein
MAFQLLIARGNSEGQQFVVVQPVIRIGRDDDNDVVLSDAGVSRQHTRIFENLGRPWVEDLGSANGTLVNGERLGLPRELKTGDALAIGAALINFVEIDALRRPAPKAVPSGVTVSTRSVTGDHLAVVKGEEPVTASGEDPQLPWPTTQKGRQLYGEESEITAPAGKAAFGEDSTQPIGKPLTEATEHRVPKLVTDQEASSNSLAPLDLTGSDLKCLTDATVADAKPLEGSTDGVPALVRHPTDAIPTRESVAERARRRRLAKEPLGIQAADWWASLPTRTQAIVTGVCAVVATVMIIGLFQVFRGEATVELPKEPDRLRVSSERIRHSFGLGEAVDYPRPDAKEFTFDFITPTDAALLVHYQAQEIDRDEVVVIVNRADVGFVPPDIGVPDRELETLIPQGVLKRGEKNTLVFDNVRNPPGKERWRVGDIWLELLPVPPAPTAEAIRRARDLARQAGQLYDQRDTGTENIFRAWKAYRLSWQVLLVVPEEQRGTLFDQTRRKAAELGQELDRQCGALMLEAKKQMELKNPERAKEILLDVGQYFPTNEHRCHALANEKLDEYQL